MPWVGSWPSANMAPGPSGELFQAFKAGRSSEAGRLQEQNRAGPQRDRRGHRSAGVSRQPWTFWATEVGIPAHPSCPLPEKTRGKVREALVRGGLLDG